MAHQAASKPHKDRPPYTGRNLPFWRSHELSAPRAGRNCLWSPAPDGAWLGDAVRRRLEVVLAVAGHIKIINDAGQSLAMNWERESSSDDGDGDSLAEGAVSGRAACKFQPKSRSGEGPVPRPGKSSSRLPNMQHGRDAFSHRFGAIAGTAQGRGSGGSRNTHRWLWVRVGCRPRHWRGGGLDEAAHDPTICGREF